MVSAAAFAVVVESAEVAAEASVLAGLDWQLASAAQEQRKKVRIHAGRHLY